MVSARRATPAAGSPSSGALGGLGALDRRRRRAAGLAGVARRRTPWQARLGGTPMRLARGGPAAPCGPDRPARPARSGGARRAPGRPDLAGVSDLAGPSPRGPAPVPCEPRRSCRPPVRPIVAPGRHGANGRPRSCRVGRRPDRSSPRARRRARRAGRCPRGSARSSSRDRSACCRGPTSGRRASSRAASRSIRRTRGCPSPARGPCSRPARWRRTAGARPRTDPSAGLVSCVFVITGVSFSSCRAWSDCAVGVRARAGSVQTEEPVDRLAICVEHRCRRVQPGLAGIGDRVHPPGGTGRPGLPGRFQEAVLLHLAEGPVQGAHGDPEQAERPQVVLDHVAVRPLERDRQQHERRQDVARRPAGQRLALVDRLGSGPASPRRPVWRWRGGQASVSWHMCLDSRLGAVLTSVDTMCRLHLESIAQVEVNVIIGEGDHVSTTTNEMPESATAAVAEASRIAAQAARNSTETAKASIEAARSYFDEANALGRDLLEHLVHPERVGPQDRLRCTECRDRCRPGPVRPGREEQSTGRRAVLELVKQTQEATLETWQTTVKATAKATDHQALTSSR